ncbi:hypothetical protein [Streptomyces sp. NPDC001658]
MWIGRPGSLREIRDGASKFERSPDLGVSEFRALGGGVTTWVAPVKPRRLVLSWSAMEADDVAHLDRLARRIGGNGPIAVLDPLAGNLFKPAQADATTDALITAWFLASAAGTGSVAFDPGALVFTFKPTTADGAVGWAGTVFGNYPAAPGMRVSLAAPPAFPATATVKIDWKTTSGTYVSTSSAVGRVLNAVAPAGAGSFTPVVVPGAVGTYSLAGACVAVDSTAVAGRPGEGCPGYSITDYTHAATPGNGAFRDIGLTLVEVTGAAG